jgi:uncharacterized protein (TIGR02284 family)
MNSRVYTHHHGSQAKVSRPNRKTVQMLKDLIRVNNDRIAGYEKASHESNEMDPATRETLARMAIESRSYVNALHADVIRLGGAPVTQDTITGKIYMYWLNLKSDFGSKGLPYRSASLPFMLDACDRGEGAIQNVYHQALETGDNLPDHIVQLLEKQMGALEQTHQIFKNIKNGPI